MNELQDAAGVLAERLRDGDTRVVFAESCTGGLIAATLAEIAGISHHLCGSAVVYRDATKQAWLEIDDATLEAEGAVSPAVAKLMAAGVLRSTPEADLAASITGHLGPDAPADLDGRAFVGVCRRGEEPTATAIQLGTPNDGDGVTTRQHRQSEAAIRTLQITARALE